MRICHYTETALPKMGGQELVIDALARQMQSRGHDITVLAARPRLPVWPRDGELPYRVVRHPRFFSTRRFVSFYQRWLLRLYRRQPFDILHCHSIYPTGFLAALVKSRLNVPIVITSHGGDVNENSVRLKRPVLRSRHLHAVQAADALVSISRFTEEGLLRLGANAEQIQCIPNGVHMEPLQQQVARPADLDPDIHAGEYVMFIGRLKERKGVDVLLRAMARVPASGGVQLVIAGDGDQRLPLEQLSAQLNLGERVRFVGAVGGAAKTWLLQSARFSVVPSRVWEAFGLVVLESFAAGTPVVASELPGLADLIEPGRTGWLVRPEAPEDLSRVMTQIFQGECNHETMGVRAAQQACQYSWSAVADQHLELYQHLLEHSHLHKAG